MTSLLFLSSFALASGTASPKPPPPPAVDLGNLPSSAVFRPADAGDRPHPVLSRLIADQSAVEAGSTVRVGVLLEQQTNWHTYWKSPGDIGLPTEIKWSLPAGATADPYEFPVPQHFELEGIVSYGYEDQVLLWSTIHLPPELPSSEVTLGADVSWLVCEVNCIPGQASLSLSLPVGTTAISPQAALFEHYQMQHPSAIGTHPELAVEMAANASALQPEKDFKYAIRLASIDGKPLPPLPETGTWPAFTPIASAELILFSASVKAGADGSWIAILEGQALALDPLPAQSSLGGLFQVDIGGKTVRTEITGVVPWASADATVIPSNSPLFAEVPAAPEATPTEAPAGPAQSAPLMMVFAFIGGLLLNIMPCVLPVLTLKLYGLVDEASLTDRDRRVAGVAYTLGILLSFAALAVVAIIAQATIGGIGWGFQFQDPRYVVALGATVFAFGLSMFGVFEIPAIGSNQMANAQAREGLAGHFLTGVFATLLATPCSAPFLGPAMGFAFSQPPAVIVLFFLTVGFGLALPFLVVAWVPALFRLLPKPGAWMETFKQLMGFTLMATTIWLASVHAAQTSRDGAVGFLTFLLFVSFGAWVFGKWGGLAETPARQWTAAIAAIALVTAGGTWSLQDSLAVAAPEPEQTGALQLEGLDFSNEIPWQSFSEANVAATAGKPVFIDFTADWCLTCKANEKTVLASEQVRNSMEKNGIIPLQADWTRRDPVITEWLKKHGRAGVPFYLVLPADRSKPAIPLPEIITGGIVTEALDQATK